MTTTFEGVSVVPMDSERVIDGQTVVVEGERITWIGPETEAPAGAQRVDGRGKYLMPGLADMHSHPYQEDDLLLLVGHGVTTIRNLRGMPRHVLWRERIAAGQLLGPTIHVSGPIVDGRPARSKGNLSVVSREEAVETVVAAEPEPGGPVDAGLVEFRRPNWTTAALLTCDGENRPVHLEQSSDLTYWHSNSATSSDADLAVRVSRVSSGS